MLRGSVWNISRGRIYEKILLTEIVFITIGTVAEYVIFTTRHFSLILITKNNDTIIVYMNVQKGVPPIGFNTHIAILK